MAQSTRRSLLGTVLAAAGIVAVAAPALAVEPGADAEILHLAAEHEQLAHEYVRYVDRSNEIDLCSSEYDAEARIGNKLWDRRVEIEERITNLRARTAAGLRAQATVGLRSLTADPTAEEPIDLPDGTVGAWNVLMAMVEALEAGVSL